MPAESAPISDPALWRRRTVIRSALAASTMSSVGGLWVGLARTSSAATLAGGATKTLPSSAAALTAWVRIDASTRDVTLVVSQAELGQGIGTTLPALLADELGADWAAVKLQTAPWDPAYRNPKYQWMFTGNSESVQAFHDHLRRMGAAAREMLIGAASQVWSVPEAECTTVDSQVLHQPTGRRLHFAEVAVAASKRPVPQHPVVRPDAELRLIGRSLARVDIPDKVSGRAVFGIDFVVPNMLIAAVRTVPEIGARLVGYDDAPARGVPGVRAVVRVTNGVAVVADRYWQAARALALIELQAEPTPASASVDTQAMEADRLRVLDQGPFATPVDENPAAESALDRFEAVYVNPCAAHATMEPMNCVADVTAQRCIVWAPTQGQDLAAVALQHALGLSPDRIAVHRTPNIGGGFGRRLLPDFVVQAALISKEVGQPVKVIWNREEDMRRDFFRPASTVRLRAGVDRRGMPSTLDVQLVTPTILAPVFPPIQEVMGKTGVDPSAMEGLEHMPYRFARRRVQFHLMKTALPTSVMRTTGYGPNLFALECFLDELAHRSRLDPFAIRRRLLAHHEGALALLDALYANSQWKRALPRGHGRGVAFAEAFGSLIGMTAEVQVKGANVRLKRVHAVIDCGRTLDPGIARAGIEGGIIFGMAYCKAESTFERGRLQQDNLAAYTLPSLRETPEIHVQFLRTARDLGGVGEIGPVTLPPALANAIFAASGRRIRSMPLSRHGLQFA